MSTNHWKDAELLSTRVAWYATAVLALTTVHHVYGAYAYQTPWRVHVAYVSGGAEGAIVAALIALERSTDRKVRRVAFWVFAGVTLLIPVLGIGLVEGAYNHALKNVLYFGGASPALLADLFPPPMYEMPNDAFFEITGVLQVVPALVTARLLYRMIRSRVAVWRVSTVG